jgi:glutamate synthase (NADPH/NADH) small chain
LFAEDNMAEKATKKEKREKIPRQPMAEQEPKVRAKNFDEVPLGYSPEKAIKEAQRCLQCKKPGCVAGCPVEIDIPGFIQLIKEEKFTESIRHIWQKNSLPAVCGRVCPQEIQCEGLCIVGKKGEPVAIGNLERFVADWERENGTGALPPKADPTGKKVAVVGSGPAGLTVAGDLIAKGHEVTVFEAFHKSGGVLVYGIPEFRLPKDIVAQEVNFLERLGVKIECNQVVGRTVTIDELFEEGYQAVFIGVGAGLPVLLDVPGKNLIGIYSANEYLTRSTSSLSMIRPLLRGKMWLPSVPEMWRWTPPAPLCVWARRTPASFIDVQGLRCRQGAQKFTTPRKKGSSSFFWRRQRNLLEMIKASGWNA